MARGRIRWYSEAKGFGFLDGEDGATLLVEFTSITANGDAFRTLPEGREVDYEVGKNERGRALARNVRPVAAPEGDRDHH